MHGHMFWRVITINTIKSPRPMPLGLGLCCATLSSWVFFRHWPTAPSMSRSTKSISARSPLPENVSVPANAPQHRYHLRDLCYLRQRRTVVLCCVVDAQCVNAYAANKSKLNPDFNHEAIDRRKADIPFQSQTRRCRCLWSRRCRMCVLCVLASVRLRRIRGIARADDLRVIIE